MNLLISAAIDIYSIVLLVFIYIYSLRSREKNSFQHKLYNRMLEIALFILVFDMLSRFDGSPGTLYPVLNHGGNFLIFLFGPILPSVFLMYTYYQIFQDEGKLKELRLPLVILNAANAVLTIVSQFTGWYYVIDNENVYHRGELFWLSPTMIILLLGTSMILVVVHFKEIDKRNLNAILILPMLPLICFILQTVTYGISILYIGLTVSLLMTFIHIQNYSIYTDYLTGAYSRKKLESYMKGKIKACSESNTFSAILVDIDNFKLINDTYGHDEGDCALATTVVLIKSCIRTTDIIARFGGDEFYVILNISSMRDLEVTVHRIMNSLGVYNEQGIKPYQLSISVGYAVYDYQSHMTMEAFQKKVDRLMYENKRANKVSITI